MIAFRCLAAVIAVAAVTATVLADEPKSGTSENEIKRLIDQLGSERFKDREQATRQLSQLGKAALPGLKEATKSPDVEVSRRAQQLIEEIQPPALRSMVPRRIPPVPAFKIYL
jgi:HEAT repeat protein